MLTIELREKVKGIFKEMHAYYNSKYTPKVKIGKHCDSCSLKNICVPRMNENQESVRRYMEKFL